MLGELVDIFIRGYRLRCPCCGAGRLFESLTSTHERCPACDERFEREPGQWFGAVYINLLLTLGVTMSSYLAFRLTGLLSTSQHVIILTAVGAVAPFAFYRLSKSFWVGIVFWGEGLYLRWPRSSDGPTARRPSGNHPASTPPNFVR